MIDKIVVSTGKKYDLWEQLKFRYELSGEKFEDKKFAPKKENLYQPEGDESVIEWLRPGQFINSHHIWTVYREPCGSWSIYQGSVGDCWLIAGFYSIKSNFSALLIKVK
jgi:hypothetical protein